MPAEWLGRRPPLPFKAMGGRIGGGSAKVKDPASPVDGEFEHRPIEQHVGAGRAQTAQGCGPRVADGLALDKDHGGGRRPPVQENRDHRRRLRTIAHQPGKEPEVMDRRAEIAHVFGKDRPKVAEQLGAANPDHRPVPARLAHLITDLIRQARPQGAGVGGERAGKTDFESMPAMAPAGAAPFGNERKAAAGLAQFEMAASQSAGKGQSLIEQIARRLRAIGKQTSGIAVGQGDQAAILAGGGKEQQWQNAGEPTLSRPGDQQIEGVVIGGGHPGDIAEAVGEQGLGLLVQVLVPIGERVLKIRHGQERWQSIDHGYGKGSAASEQAIGNPREPYYTPWQPFLRPFATAMFLETDQYHLPTAIPALAGPRVDTLCQQGSGPRNEDLVLADQDLYGVFDGATSLEGETFDGGRKSGGQLAAAIAAKTFAETGGPLARRAVLANRRLAEAQRACGIDGRQRHRLWSTSLAVVRLDEDTFEYCQTGDAMILLLLTNGGHRLLTPEVDIDGETLALWQRAAEAGASDIYQALGQQIRRVRLAMNVTYGVLNGEERAVKFLRHGREELAGVSDILLFTDGLFLPCRTPGATGNWEEFAAIYRRQGLAGLHHQVRRRQKTDPDCHIYPRFKRHDDIAAVAINLHGASQPAMALA